MDDARVKTFDSTKTKSFHHWENGSVFRLLRNKVNRERKRCRKLYYNAKVRELSGSKPRDWWREVKQLCGLKT